jgi:hypothetical protein
MRAAAKSRLGIARIPGPAGFGTGTAIVGNSQGLVKHRNAGELGEHGCHEKDSFQHGISSFGGVERRIGRLRPALVGIGRPSMPARVTPEFRFPRKLLIFSTFGTVSALRRSGRVDTGGRAPRGRGPEPGAPGRGARRPGGGVGNRKRGDNAVPNSLKSSPDYADF